MNKFACWRWTKTIETPIWESSYKKIKYDICKFIWNISLSNESEKTIEHVVNNTEPASGVYFEIIESSTGDEMKPIGDVILNNYISAILCMNFKNDERIILFGEIINARKALHSMWVSDVNEIENTKVKLLFLLGRFSDALSLRSNLVDSLGNLISSDRTR
jgi:hypothetical protein